MKNYKRMLRNLLVFIALIIITFYIIFKDQNINEINNIILNIDLRFFLLGLLSMLLYFGLESYNIKSVIEALGTKVKIINAFRYTLTGFFFSGITPAATGGQPMEIYYMKKDGIPIAYSSVALIVELISFQIVTISCCIISAIIKPSLLSNGLIYLFIVGVSLNVIALSTMLVCFLSEKLAFKLADFFIDILKFFRYKKVDKKRAQIESTIKKYGENAALIKNNKGLIVKSFIIVLFQVLFYYSIPYWVYRSFGLNSLHIWDIVIMQALLFCSVSAIPLPGSVGISESAFLRIYNQIFGEKYLTSATLLNRFSNFYLFIIISLIVVLCSSIKGKNRVVADDTDNDIEIK